MIHAGVAGFHYNYSSYRHGVLKSEDWHRVAIAFIQAQDKKQTNNINTLTVVDLPCRRCLLFVAGQNSYIQ